MSEPFGPLQTGNQWLLFSNRNRERIIPPKHQRAFPPRCTPANARNACPCATEAQAIALGQSLWRPTKEASWEFASNATAMLDLPPWRSLSLIPALLAKAAVGH